MNNKFSLFFVLALIAVFASGYALADTWNITTIPDIKEMIVYINDNAVWYGECVNESVNESVQYTCTTEQLLSPAIERGELITLKTTFISYKDLEKVKLNAWVSGYRDDIEAETSKFDVFAGSVYTRTVELKIPQDIDAKDDYTFYVRIESKNDLSGIDEARIDSDIQRIANILDILSVDIYNQPFTAGSTLYADVVVKNRGNYKAEDVYVKVSIKQLNLERTVYVGDLESVDDNSNDDEDNEDAREVTIALPLPQNARTDTYTIEVIAYNDDSSVIGTRSFVLEGVKQIAPTERKIEITPQTTTNTIEPGKGAVYTVLINNAGTTTEKFAVDVVGIDGWATATINPSSFSLGAGQSKTVNIYVVANEDALAEDQTFTATIKYGDQTKQYDFTATIAKPAQKIDMKSFLLIVGIVFAIVIIILLILLLTQQQKKEEETESYY